MLKILVSACLLGEPVRYDGRVLPTADGLLSRWQAEGRLVTICPEVLGGLAVPRPRAEIVGGDGQAVLEGAAKVVTADNLDVTAAFASGAMAALTAATHHDIHHAILKSRSPSCGSSAVFDGTFTGVQRSGQGVTAALLLRHGIAVFDESEIEQLGAVIARHERT